MIVESFPIAEIAKRHPYAHAEMQYHRTLGRLPPIQRKQRLADATLVILLPCILTVRTQENLIIPEQLEVALSPGTIVLGMIEGRIVLEQTRKGLTAPYL